MKTEPVILNNPLAQVSLSIMRDESTDSASFRGACHRLGAALAVATAEYLPTSEREIQTPLEKAPGHMWLPICLIPILRAGLGLLKPFHDLYPNATVGQIGMRRNEETLEAETYLEKMPTSLQGSTAVVLDPMLATGHSLVATLQIIKTYQPDRILIACALAAPEGIKEVQTHFPESQLVIGCLDRELNDKGYILPGLGDAGDRIFGTD
ncbi:MAG: uracil phosphoribosyltransferase [Verrucomicrobiota bacterium]